MVEVWESWEHRLKEKLEGIDHITREMFKEMVFTRTASSDNIRNFLQEHFAMLWEQVAAEQEVKSRRRTGE